MARRLLRSLNTGRLLGVAIAGLLGSSIPPAIDNQTGGERNHASCLQHEKRYRLIPCSREYLYEIAYSEREEGQGTNDQ